MQKTNNQKPQIIIKNGITFYWAAGIGRYVTIPENEEE
jgi:hypothetical protein